MKRDTLKIEDGYYTIQNDKFVLRSYEWTQRLALLHTATCSSCTQV